MQTIFLHSFHFISSLNSTALLAVLEDTQGNVEGSSDSCTEFSVTLSCHLTDQIISVSCDFFVFVLSVFDSNTKLTEKIQLISQN